eukprot:gene25239-30482_t
MEAGNASSCLKNFYQIDKELRYDANNNEAFLKVSEENELNTLSAENVPEDYRRYLTMTEEEIQREIDAAEAELQSVLTQQKESDRSYAETLQKLRETHLLETELAQSINSMDMDNKELQDEILALDTDIERTSDTLSKYMQMNSLNDVFHIWYAGPYGTITNFRLGNIPIKPIDSNEINAALGQAALLVDTIADKLGYAFKSFNIIPMGSFARICKLDAKKQVFPLHLEASGYLLYPKWHFNQAMIGFMTCIIELGEVCGDTDPTLSMPYKISIADSKIGDVSFTYGTDDESWTRAMKYMLSNIKWLVAWATKHAQDYVS